MKSRRNNRPVRHVHFSFRPVFCCKWKLNDITRGANQTLILNAVNLLRLEAWIPTEPGPRLLPVTWDHLFFSGFIVHIAAFKSLCDWVFEEREEILKLNTRKIIANHVAHGTARENSCNVDFFTKCFRCGWSVRTFLNKKGYSTQFSMKWGSKFKPDNHDKAN